MSTSSSARTRLQHVSLPIPDGAQNTVRAFYGDVLGLVEKPTPSTFELGRIVWFAVGDDESELHFIPDTLLPVPTEKRHFCMSIEHLEDMRRRLSDAGHEVWDGSTIPNRPRFFCRDPFGNLIEFVTILGDYKTSQE